jgi:hypothetical protein
MVLSPYRTPLQRRLDDRNLVIFAAHEFGCPVRLIARALGIDPARVRQVLDDWEHAKNSPPEDSR